MQISVFGAEENVSDHQRREASSVGYYVAKRGIAKRGIILITDARNSLSYDAACSAYVHGATVIGISSAKSAREHESEGCPSTNPFSAFFFTDTSAWQRNVVMLQSCDAAILLDESTPTINTFSFAYKETRRDNFVVGILAENGADTMAKIAEKTGICASTIIVKDNPESLVLGVIDKILRRHKAIRQELISVPIERRNRYERKESA